MDTNMVYGIIAVVVIAVLLIVGGIWMDRSRKKNIQQSQEAAKAKADEIEDAKGTYQTLDARLDAMDAATDDRLEAITTEQLNAIFN